MRRKLLIDFLYLDLDYCGRCKITDKSLKKAIGILSNIFDLLNYKVKINKVNITTAKLAQKYHFISSPTIRVNGIDIYTNIEENDCAECSELCGSSVECRTFTYNGKKYNEMPVEMIAEGILQTIYGKKNPVKLYKLPKNLKKYFNAKKIK